MKVKPHFLKSSVTLGESTVKSHVFRKTEKILYIYPDIKQVKNEFLQCMSDSLQKLSVDERKLIELKYFNKMTHEQIAEIMGIDTKTVTRRKNMIIRRLMFMFFPDEAIEELKNE